MSTSPLLKFVHENFRIAKWSKLPHINTLLKNEWTLGVNKEISL